MKKQFFFDTSAIIKLYHEEERSDKLSSMINMHDPLIIISDLTTIEFVSGFAKKVKTKQISQNTFKAVVSLFENDVLKFKNKPINLIEI